MKKFKRTICIALTIITCLSAFACSGSCLRSCKRVIWSNLMNLGREEAGKQKAALDSAQKQVDGYKLIVDYTKKEYEIDNEWERLLGDHEYITIFHKGSYKGKTAVGGMSHALGEIVYLQIEEDDEVIEISIEIDFTIIFAEYEEIENYNGGRLQRCLYCCDGTWFYICVRYPEISLSAPRYYLSATILPPLFYLLDFENNTMYYAGYADGWYENAKKMDYFGQSPSWEFDTVKVIKDENI